MIQVEGQLGSQFIRQSTGTRAWSQAVAMVRKAERIGEWSKEKTVEEPAPGSGRGIAEIVDEYLADCESEQGKQLSGGDHEQIPYDPRPPCRTLQLEWLRNDGSSNLRRAAILQEDLPNGPPSTANNIARVRSFWKFAVKCGYATKNVASELEMPRNYSNAERLPFTEEEMARILGTARTMRLDPQQPCSNDELEAFILVPRFGGLAIAAPALLQKSELKGDEIRYFRKKTQRSATRQLVVVPLSRP